MCQFCISHGEGKKWYEVMQNYSKELQYSGNRNKLAKKIMGYTLTSAVVDVEKMIKLKRKSPLVSKYFGKMGTLLMKRYHFGQIVPLEDAEMIIDLAQSITRMPCVCRRAVKGEKNARYCFGLGYDPASIFGDYPDIQASLETLTKQEAKDLLRKFDEEGLIHSIWTMKTPYIGGLCNCDRDCLAYTSQVSNGLMQIMFKSEYIAKINPLGCTGCRSCQKLCQYEAIEYSSVDGKCYINPLKCYGCGVCRTACGQELITLEDKGKLPEIYRTW